MIRSRAVPGSVGSNVKNAWARAGIAPIGRTFPCGFTPLKSERMPVAGSSLVMVLPDRIELSTSPLPRECSTTELRQRLIFRMPRNRHRAAGGNCHTGPCGARTACPAATAAAIRPHDEDVLVRSPRWSQDRTESDARGATCDGAEIQSSAPQGAGPRACGGAVHSRCGTCRAPRFRRNCRRQAKRLDLSRVGAGAG